MKQMSISLPRKAFVPGEEVTGKVILYCNEPFKSKKATFLIEGAMIYEFTTLEGKRGGVKKKKETKTWLLHHAESVFAENTEFDSGTHEFNFQFQLPDVLKPSYEGPAVRIVYVIGATMEISRLSKLEDISLIYILNPTTELQDEAREESHSDIAGYSFKIKKDSQKHNNGDKLTFHYCIDTDEKFKSLRIEIEHVETAPPAMKRTRKQAILVDEIPSEKITRREWIEYTSKTKLQFPVTIAEGPLKSELALKVTVVKKLGFDIDLKIPLIVGNDLKPGWRDEMGTFGHGMRKIKHEVAKLDEPAERELSDEERVALTWYNRAVSFREEGEIDEAIRSVEKALEFHPDNAHALALRDGLKSHKE